MRYFGLVLFLALAVGCSGTNGGSESSEPPTTAAADPVPTGELHKDVALANDRTFNLYEPDSTDDLRPAVIVFHGQPSNPVAVQNDSGMNLLADHEGFLVAYGRGLDQEWADIDGTDVAYVRGLISELVQNWGADPDRIFVTGISNGADMAITAALSLPAEIAAAAPVVPSSTMGVGDVIEKLAAPTDVVALVGGADPRHDSGLELLESLRAGGGCANPETVEDAELVTTTSTCRDGTTFVIHDIVDGGHEWFGAPDSREPLWASAAMWEFFESIR